MRRSLIPPVARWHLVLKTLPVVAAAVAAKLAIDEFGWSTLDLNPLFTGLLTATVFLLGFLLAGTLSDYKESERLPSEIAAGLETIADECEILRRGGGGAAVAAEGFEAVTALAGDLRSWLRRRIGTAAVYERLTALNRVFFAMEPHTQPNFIVRLKQEQHTLRRMILRVDTIRETSFVGAGYAIAELSVLLLVVGLLFVDLAPLFQAVFLPSIITFVLVYMVLLIKDLDNPFDYHENGRAGSAEVSLRPLDDVERRLAERAAAWSATPAGAE